MSRLFGSSPPFLKLLTGLYGSERASEISPFLRPSTARNCPSAQIHAGFIKRPGANHRQPRGRGQVSDDKHAGSGVERNFPKSYNQGLDPRRSRWRRSRCDVSVFTARDPLVCFRNSPGREGGGYTGRVCLCSALLSRTLSLHPVHHPSTLCRQRHRQRLYRRDAALSLTESRLCNRVHTIKCFPIAPGISRLLGDASPVIANFVGMCERSGEHWLRCLPGL